MEGIDRRTLLATGGSVLASGMVAGCGNSESSQPKEPDAVGDTAAINGVEITFTDYSLESKISYVPRQDDELTVGTPGDDRETKTVEAGSGYQWLVVLVDIENVADEPKQVPAPGGSAVADGEITLEWKEEIQGRKIPHVPFGVNDEDAIDGAYNAGGEWFDRLAIAVGSHRGELSAGESVAGWIPYRVSADFDPSEVKLIARTNPNGANQNFDWEFTTE